MALKLALFLALACILQAQSLPVTPNNVNDFKLLYLFNTTTNVYVGSDLRNLTAVSTLEGTVFGDKPASLESVAQVLGKQVQALQAQPQSLQPVITAQSVTLQGLPLVYSVNRTLMATSGPRPVKDFGLVLVYNLYAKK